MFDTPASAPALEESCDVGPVNYEPATLASIVLSCITDRPVAVFVAHEAAALRCVPAAALNEMLGDIQLDDIVGVYSPKAPLDEIADDIRAYTEARFGQAGTVVAGIGLDRAA